MRHRYPISIILFLCLPFFALGADLRLPSILGSHMVLQQNTLVNIWGWARPGASVKVNTGWNNLDFQTTADPSGKWILKVPTGTAGGPYEILVKADTSILLEDVLLGEVWICSGQSNMEFPLNRAGSATTELPHSLFPYIRLFTVEKRIASRPREDVSGAWNRCTPRTAKDFSAVGYFFGKELHKELNVPVGLIHASWGGTPSQAWTSRETLQNFDFFQGELKEIYSVSESQMDLAKNARDSIEDIIRVQGDFMNFENIGLRDGWMKPDLDDSDWTEVPCPARWSSIAGVGMLEGVAWMRTRFVVPDNWTGKAMVIRLGPVDEMDVTYLNGRKIGSSMRIENWDKERIYKIPGFLVTSGENQLAIRIVNTSEDGGIFGEPGQLEVSSQVEEGSEPVMLSGKWKFRVAYKFPKIPDLFDPKNSTVLFNGMIYPLKNMTIKGAIWYQGESNVAMPALYGEIFPAMIQDWRSAWGEGDFPFYYVQIAPYDYGSDELGPRLREAQFLTLSKVRNTGMVVTLDIGDPGNIHPSDKRDVGKRLALWALDRDYGKERVHSGPLYSSMEIEGRKIRLHFIHTGSGLEARGGQLNHFEIAGDDRVFLPARAVLEGTTVLVSNPSVDSPVAVRYGWSATAEPNLFNMEGLPATSFRTDSWPDDPQTESH